MKIVAKCCVMKGGWIRYDGMGERKKSLYVRMLKRDVFTQRWERTLKWMTDFISAVHFVIMTITSFFRVSIGNSLCIIMIVMILIATQHLISFAAVFLPSCTYISRYCIPSLCNH